jgi:DNA repair protein RadC
MTTRTTSDRHPSQLHPNTAASAKALREAIAPYVTVAKLRRLVAKGGDLRQALRQPDPPPEVLALLDMMKALITPDPRMQIKSPADVAGLLLFELGYLDQEQLRTVLLDTKNRVQSIPTIYQGSLNASMVRVGELFRAALQWNSAALIIVHNHPSGDPTPSPEDVLLTRKIVEAGKLLDVEVLDHLVIGHGKYISMRERGLGFSK